MNYVQLSLEGPGRLLGMDNGDSTDYDPYKGCVRKLFNGKLLAVVAGVPGDPEVPEGPAGTAAMASYPAGTTYQPENCVRIIAEALGLESASLEIGVEPASLRPGGCAGEDVSRTDSALPDIIPVRKVELLAPEGSILEPARPGILLEARICPEEATDRGLSWKAVNQNGIPVSFARVEVLEDCRARITALGDGAF